MKVKELIEELSKYDGELDVRLYTDHGQVMMGAHEVCLCSCEDANYMLEDFLVEDDEYFEEYENRFVGVWA